MHWRRSPRSSTASAARACSGPGHPSSRCLACRRRLAAASGRPGHCPWIRKTGTGSPAASSHPSAQNGTRLLLSALRRAVAEGLSGEQRTVFTAVTLHGVPAAALAAAPGSNRNAIYKALFEARRILRARLAANRRDLAYLPGAPWTGPPWLDDLLGADPGDTGVRSSVPRTGPLRRGRTQRNGPGQPGSRDWPRTCAAAKPAITTIRAAGRGKGLRARRAGEVTDVRTPAACDGGGPGPLLDNWPSSFAVTYLAIIAGDQHSWWLGGRRDRRPYLADKALPPVPASR